MSSSRWSPKSENVPKKSGAEIAYKQYAYVNMLIVATTTVEYLEKLDDFTLVRRKD